MDPRKKRKIIILVLVIILLLAMLPFSLAVSIYKSNFGDRYEMYPPMSRSIDEFDELKMDRLFFYSNEGQKLAGYKYYKDIEEVVGVVVIAHGLGGGGHNSYMDIADYLASNGYVVFAYDATGNDNSEGDSVKGIPQGLIDLDYAIGFVKETSDFDNLPIMLFGHSWGAYAAGSVLNYHPDIRAVVMVSGFDKSLDIIEEEGRRIAGNGIDAIFPYIGLYENFKFGEYAGKGALNGFENSAACIMVVNSVDDEMISSEKSYDVFFNRYKDDSRFRFVQYKERGHDWIWYSDKARAYKDSFDIDFENHLRALEDEFTPEIKADYLDENLDKSLLYDLDEDFMMNVLGFYDSCL